MFSKTEEENLAIILTPPTDHDRIIEDDDDPYGLTIPVERILNESRHWYGRGSSWPPRGAWRLCSVSNQEIEEMIKLINSPDPIKTRPRSRSYERRSGSFPDQRESRRVPYILDFGENAAEIIKSLYNPMERCKSAGVIPYTIHKGELLFLFQRLIDPVRKKDSGWNDFGGKRIVSFNEETGIYDVEETIRTAAREFSEETSCLFYIQDHGLKSEYEELRGRPLLDYSDQDVDLLKRLFEPSTAYHENKIRELVIPLYVSSKETYISYLLEVNYLPAEDLPRAEDIHIDYEERYIRTCQWFSFDELLSLPESSFHKRLQITRIQQRIRSYYAKGHFSDDS